MRSTGWIAYGLLGAVFGLGLTTGCSGSSKVITPEGEGGAAGAAGAAGTGGSGGSTSCYTLAFASPEDGASLTEKDDADNDACVNGFQYNVVVSTDAPTGTLINLYASTGKLGQAAVNNGVARFPMVQLASTGTETLRAEVDATKCETEVTVSTHCAGAASCEITKPKPSATHPKLNGVPASEGGDRVSADGSPYQTAFEISTSIEDGQPVVLTVDDKFPGLTVFAKGGKAIFPGVNLEPAKQHQVMAACTPKVGQQGLSAKVTYDVDIEAPPLTAQKDLNQGEVTDLADGDHFGPADDADAAKAGLQMKICGATDKTKAPDAVDLLPSLGEGQNNFCVAVGTNSPTCLPAKTSGGALGTDGACASIDCPGSGAFNLTVTLRDNAGNPQIKTFQGITCASKNPQVQMVSPLDSGDPNNPTKLLAAGAAAPNLADKDSTKAGAQYDVVACTSADSGTASLLAGSKDGTIKMAEIATGTVEKDAANLCTSTGFTHVVKFNGATIRESLEDNDGNLSSATEIQVEVTDSNNGKGSAQAELWVDSYAPTLTEQYPNPLCNTHMQPDSPGGDVKTQSVTFKSGAAPVHMTVANSQGSQSYTATTLTGSGTAEMADQNGNKHVKFYKGQNTVTAGNSEPSGNVGALISPCVVTVGSPPIITWQTPTAASKLAGNKASGTNVIADSDAAAVGWQGTLKVCLSKFGYDANDSSKTTDVTFTSSQDGTLGGGPVKVDSSGCATLNNVDLSENDASTLTATATYENEKGSAGITVPVDVHDPGAAVGLTFSILDRRQTSFHLKWNAPSDGTKPVAGYQVRYSESPITTDADFNQANSVAYTGKPAQPGQSDGIDVANLLIEHEYYFALRAIDISGNVGPISSQGKAVAHFNQRFYFGAAGDKLGISTDGSSSINGDSLSDLVVGPYTGKAVKIYFGAPSGLPVAPDVTITGFDTGFGQHVAYIGDVDGDSFTDLAIASSSGEGNGAVYIFKGRASWPSSLTQADADYVIAAENAYAGTNFGWRIIPIGDFNKDGVDDFAFGATKINSNAGQEIIIFGSSTLPKQISLPSDFGNGKHALKIDGDTTDVGKLGVNAVGLGSFYTTPSGQSSLAVLAPYMASNGGKIFAFHGYDLIDNPLNVSNASHSTSGVASSYLGKAMGILRIPSAAYPLLVASAPTDGNGKVIVFSGDSAQGPFANTQCTISNSKETSNSFGQGLNTGTFSGSAVSTSFIGTSTPDLVVVGKKGGTIGSTVGSIYVIDGDALLSHPTIDAATQADVVIPLEVDWSFSSNYTSALNDSNGDGYGDIVLGDLFYGGDKGRVLVLW